jgi:glycosyltransferase involved in cell wall biosynthesis
MRDGPTSGGGAGPHLRVLHVVATDRRRGAETFTADLVRCLNDAGVDQMVAVLRPGRSDAIPFEAPVEGMGDGWRVPGVRLKSGAVRGLRRLIASWKPHVVQVSGGEPLKHVMAATGSRGRVIYRRIGSSDGREGGRLRWQAYGWLMRRGARVVAVAEALRRETIEIFGVPPDRVAVIPKGVDARRLEPARGRDATRQGLGIPPSARVVTSLGALTWEKDPVGHLHVMSLVREAIPDAVHLIVGEGPLRPAVAEEAARLDPAGRTTLLGSRADVGDLLAASDVVLLASRSEGLPGSLIEAGLTGLASAAYDLAGVSEVLADEATGLLAPPGDQAALAAAVTRLLQDDRTRAEMGRAARERCAARFGIGTVGQAYLALYRELTG